MMISFPSLAAWSVFFLILGTSIGAGMMSLPLMVQSLSFLQMTVVLASAAFVMYGAAKIWIDLAYSFPKEAHLTTYVRQLMPSLEMPTHAAYLLFFWSLMAYYLSTLPTFLGAHTSQAIFLEPGFYAVVLIAFLNLPTIAQGIVNQLAVGLMFFALGMIVWSLAHAKDVLSLSWPIHGQRHLSVFLPLMMFFGYHLSIPAFRSYNLEKSSLTKIAFFGAMGTFGIYWLWCSVLLSFLGHDQSSLVSQSALIGYLVEHASSEALLRPIAGFSLFAMLTSCLGMSVGTYVYLEDFARSRGWAFRSIVLAGLTILPALLFLYAAGEAYQALLQFASKLALYLLILLPALLKIKQALVEKKRPSFLAIFMFMLSLVFLALA